MQRRTILKAGLGLASLPILPRFAFAADQKPVSFWYESASPENQDNLKNLLIDPFNAAHPEDLLSIDFRGSDLDKQLRIAMLSGMVAVTRCTMAWRSAALNAGLIPERVSSRRRMITPGLERGAADAVRAFS